MLYALFPMPFQIRNSKFEIVFCRPSSVVCSLTSDLRPPTSGSLLHAPCPMPNPKFAIRNSQFAILSSVVFPRLARLARPPVSPQTPCIVYQVYRLSRPFLFQAKFAGYFPRGCLDEGQKLVFR